MSTLFLFICWAAMTFGAFLVLEVNFYLDSGTNMISMAKKTLGSPGALVTWVSYLFLLLALLSAYISGGADLLGSSLSKLHINLKPWQSSLIFTTVFGAVVYSGIRQVDWLNRLLMFGKLGAFFVLIILITPKVDLSHFRGGDYRYALGTTMILLTSFGFAIIVPSLRQYFNDDLQRLRQAILIGSVIPLVCYIAWDAVIMGALPNGGDTGLASLMHSEHTTSDLAKLLENTIQQSTTSSLFDFFISISMLTAFLGVSLCLFSFLSDGLGLQASGKQGLLLCALTFGPSLALVLYYPGAYIHALSYAGIFVVILLLLLPALMALAGRKRNMGSYHVTGGKGALYLTVAFSVIALGNALYRMFLL